jgi:hypothetical protein
MHQDMNGAHLLILGELRSDVKHVKVKVQEVQHDVRSLASRVGVVETERRFKVPYKEMGGFFIGLSALLAAVAHRWDLVAPLARAFGK